MDRITCIIPTYNEAPRIGAVVGVIAAHPLVQEVIVVDDASTDNTAAVLAEFPSITVVRHDINSGKTMALYTGLIRSTKPVVMFIDADLVGLTADDITRLIKPVMQGKADISISLRNNVTLFERLIGLDYISGERVFRREILADALPTLPSLPRFGFEVFFNRIIIAHRYRIAIVPWKNVISPYPTRKYGRHEGMKRLRGMLRDMLNTVSVAEMIHQYWAMWRLKKTYVQNH